MKSNSSKGLFLIIFFIIIFVPTFLSIFHFSSGMKLNGVVIEEVPVLSLSGVMDGTYQNSLEKYHSQKLGGRDIIVRLGNQFVYSVFKKSTHTGESLGKNGQIFETWYIVQKLQIIKPVTSDYVDDLIKKLEKLQFKLNNKGINLFVFVTPSKAEIYSNDFPDLYYKCAPEQQESSYAKFIDKLYRSNIQFYDSVKYVQDLKENEGIQPFAKTGTHWTQVTGARVASQLINELEAAFQYDLTDFSIEITEVESPLVPDADIFNLLNILQKPYDRYYAPVTKVNNIGSDQPAAIFRGGSFMGQSLTWLINNDILSDCVHIENSNVISNKYTEVQYFTQYDELDINNLLKDKEIMILEVNQSVIDQMSFGFIDYLLDNKMLD